MKQVPTCFDRLILGFAVETAQTRLVIIDSYLCRKYQAESGQQEWIMMIECICANEGLISPLIIFKGKNLMINWIPHDVLNK